MARATLAFCLLAVLGCRDEATQLIVVVDSDIEELTAVELFVEPGDEPDADSDRRIELGVEATLPFSFGVAPRKGIDPESQSPRLRAVAYSGATELVERRVQVGFIKGKTLHLLMYLAEACRGLTCDAGQTCDRGICVSEYIDPSDLPRVKPRDAITFDAGGPPADASFDVAFDGPDAAPGLAAPRILYPWNGVAARTIELAWEPPAGALSTHVAYGSSCDGDIATCDPGGASDVVTTTESSLAFSMDGRWYFRVQACRDSAGTDCGEWSETRYFDFGRTDLDMNRDGVDDVVIGAAGFGATDEGRAWWYGSAFPGTPTRITPAPARAGRRFGALLAFVGDIDADGSPDLAIGSTGTPGEVSLYHGGSPPMEEASNITRDPLLALAGIGDVDGDGFADFATSDGVSAWVHHDDGGTVEVDLEVAGVTSIAGVGDVDGDGLADFAVGIPEDDSVIFFSGSRARVYPRIEIPPPSPNRTFGAFVAGVGDIDDDMIPDLFIGAPDLNETPRNGVGQALTVSGSTIPLMPRVTGVSVASSDYRHVGTAAVQTTDGSFAVAASGEAMRDVEGNVTEIGGSVVPRPSELGTGWGYAVACGDHDGNGTFEIIVSAPRGGAGAQGEVRIFELRPTIAIIDFVLIPDTPEIGGIESAFGSLATAPVSRLR